MAKCPPIGYCLKLLIHLCNLCTPKLQCKEIVKSHIGETVATGHGRDFLLNPLCAFSYLHVSY